MKQQIISLLEGKKKEMYPDRITVLLHKEEEKHRISFNQGIDTAIESVDEIVEIIVKEIEKSRIDLVVETDTSMATRKEFTNPVWINGNNETVDKIINLLNK